MNRLIENARLAWEQAIAENRDHAYINDRWKVYAHLRFGASF